MRFNAVELAIITVMRRSPNELANMTKIAWETADKTLKSLHEKGYLVGGKKKSRIYWRLYQSYINHQS